MNVVTQVAERVSSMIKDHIKLKSLNRDDLYDFIENNISQHEKVIYVLNSKTDYEIQQWMREKVKPALKTCSSPAKTVYETYLKYLSGRCPKYEVDRPLKSLSEANEKYLDILEEVRNKLDKIIEGESITLQNVRMSHLAVLGILHQSDIVLNFSIFLFTFLSRVPSRTTDSIPKYRTQFLIDNVKTVAFAVNDILNGRNRYSFMEDVKKTRIRNADSVLGAISTYGAAPISSFSISFLDNLVSALSCLNFFSAAMNAWDDYKLARYEKNKETKEWLENHVSLLTLDLENMEKGSPEYNKQVAIINAYDAKITEYDQAIREFEEEV